MADLQKTIKGLRCHSEPKFGPDEYFCETCPYDEATCGLDVPNDALSLLKAQEPRVMTLEEVLEWAETPAEKRDPIFFEQKEGKGPNGWICNSVCPKDYYLCCLDKDARCWTARPTDEQREEEPWGN